MAAKFSSLQTILVRAVAILFVCFSSFCFVLNRREREEWEEMELRRNCPNLVTISFSLFLPYQERRLQLALVHMAWPV